jgi:hypothetical protein
MVDNVDRNIERLKLLLKNIDTMKKEIIMMEKEKSEILEKIYNEKKDVFVKLKYFNNKDEMITKNDVICEDDSEYYVSSDTE